MGVRDANAAETSLRLGQSLVVVVTALLVASVTFSVAETIAGAFGVGGDTAELAAVRTIGQFVGFVVVAVGFLSAVGDRDLVPVRTPTAREAALIAGGVVGLLAVQFGLLLGLRAAGIEIGQNQAIVVGREAPVYFLYMLPISVLVVGPAEELIFRGVVQGELKRAVGPVGAVAGASLLFGLIHATVAGTPLQKLAYVLIAALLGVGLGALYEYTGNLVVPAVVHGCYNATLFAVQYLETTGTL